MIVGKSKSSMVVKLSAVVLILFNVVFKLFTGISSRVFKQTLRSTIKCIDSHTLFKGQDWDQYINDMLFSLN